MRSDIVLTLTGPDRVGIVEEVTGVLLGIEGNVGTGRMARLGGEFAILLLVSLPAANVPQIDAAFTSLVREGYKITFGETATAAEAPPAAFDVYRIDVRGADHEGIIHEVARELSRLGINIESAETGTVEAPVTGVPLFFMKTLVHVPPQLAQAEWMAALDEAARAAGVDIDVTLEPTPGSLS